MELATRFVLSLAVICFLVPIGSGKIEGIDKQRKIGKNGLPDTNVVVNADESKDADCGIDLSQLRGARRGKRRIHLTPDGAVVNAGNGSDVNVTGKEGPGWQAVVIHEKCKGKATKRARGSRT
ncbi:hypothetical protein AAVH_29887 [Aphelenchoides avenae]|nr:hypothetical protein AAVH_29887 [Aphelenchus avenae]